MNPDSSMQEILEDLQFQGTRYRRGLLNMEQMLDVIVQSAKLLSVKVIEYERKRDWASSHLQRRHEQSRNTKEG